MATITVRGLDDETKALLRLSAARHGRSMEAEVRAILKDALPSQQVAGGLGSRIQTRFAAIEGVELELPDRRAIPHAADPQA